MKKLSISVLSVLVLALFSLNCTSFADDLQLLHTKKFSVEGNGKLLLGTATGDVEITASGQNEVEVSIYCNEKAKDNMRFKMEKEGNSIIVKGEKASATNWFSNVNVKYKIRLPKSFLLDVKTAGGDISVNGVNSECNLKTSGGDITLHDVRGKMNIATSGGDISLKRVSGDINAATSGGDIEILASDSEIKATTSGGDIKCIYNGDNRGIKLTTSGGDIDISLPESIKANLEANTSGGGVSNYLPTTKVVKSSAMRLSAEINGGGKEIKASTSGGDIVVKKNQN